jgi:heme exporter protein C
MFNYFANIRRFQQLMQYLQRICAPLSLICLGLGGYIGLFASPEDYQQGEFVRIMYVHVPAAWTSLFIYSVMSVASLSFLVWRHVAADLVARLSGSIAWVMCAITLITGSLWGKPTWGTYWVWDARLTSMLILWLIISGYMLLAMEANHNFKRQRICAIFCLFGALNLPIIKFSVEWWETLHQPASILRSGGIAIDSAMLTPLLIMGVGFMAFYGWILSLKVQNYMLEVSVKKNKKIS